jgi:hypothetical protein
VLRQDHVFHRQVCGVGPLTSVEIVIVFPRFVVCQVLRVAKAPDRGLQCSVEDLWR